MFIPDAVPMRASVLKSFPRKKKKKKRRRLVVNDGMDPKSALKDFTSKKDSISKTLRMEKTKPITKRPRASIPIQRPSKRNVPNVKLLGKKRKRSRRDGIRKKRKSFLFQTESKAKRAQRAKLIRHHEAKEQLEAKMQKLREEIKKLGYMKKLKDKQIQVNYVEQELERLQGQMQKMNETHFQQIWKKKRVLF